MSLPITLSPSPVQEAFATIHWDNVSKLKLSRQEIQLLRSAEDTPMEYTVADPQDAEAYAQLLLKVLDQVMMIGTTQQHQQQQQQQQQHYPTARSTQVAKLPLEQPSLSEEEAVQYHENDPLGVISHYIVSKLCELVMCLRDAAAFSKQQKVSLATTFYPSGILVDNWRPLLRVAMGTSGASDAFAQRGSAFCLACILLEGCNLEKEGRLFSSVNAIVETFVSWMTSRLQSSASRSLMTVTPSLVILIVSQQARTALNKAGGIGYISRHLRIRQQEQQQQYQADSPTNTRPLATVTTRTGPSVQQLYELTYCLWLMSFECETDDSFRKHFHRDGAVPALVDLVAAAPREKVVRLALATLCHLAQCSSNNSTTSSKWTGNNFLNEMIGCGLIKSMELLQHRKFSDPDVESDIETLSALLKEAYRELTRWDVYRLEVESAHLHWGIVHTEQFFRENAVRMEGPMGNFQIVKTLLRLAESNDDEIAAIACFDIGEFVRHYPNGRAVAKRLGARDVIMKLIDSENEQLQHQAIVCVSKMLVNNWEMIR